MYYIHNYIFLLTYQSKLNKSKAYNFYACYNELVRIQQQNSVLCRHESQLTNYLSECI